jgi:hypothetical protein
LRSLYQFQFNKGQQGPGSIGATGGTIGALLSGGGSYRGVDQHSLM